MLYIIPHTGNFYGVFMGEEFLQTCKGFALDYGFLMEQLKAYSDPRGKISRMLKQGKIVRVKKGLYVLGSIYRSVPVDRASLANLIYGPSYVSGLYALSFYNMIPERVETVTCMTTGKNKVFSTDFGKFEYRHIRESRYAVGVSIKRDAKGQKTLFATPEKAFADLLAKEKGITSFKKLEELLFENLRVDEEEFQRMNSNLLDKIAALYGNSTVEILAKFLKRIK